MHSLRFRFFLILFLVAVLAVGVVAYFANRGTTNSFNSYVAENFTRDQQVIKELLTMPIEDGNFEEAQEIADAFGEAYGRPIIITGEKGEIILSSEDTVIEFAPEVEFFQFEGEAIQLNETAVTHPATITAYNFIVGPERQIEYLVEPDFAQTLPPGFEIELPPSSVNTQTQLTPTNESRFLGSVSQTFGIATVTAVLLAGVLSLGLTHQILKPIQALTTAAQKMEKGDLSQEVSVRSKDEIGTLAHAFNNMASSLATQEILRRNMVSDVAHELRTPLSNIQGYLEAVQDGILTPDTDLINSLHEESLLLNRLINDLQELSLAEAGQLRLSKQPTDLAEIINQAVKNSQPRAIEHQVLLESELAENLPVVAVDQERMGQILRNLIDNGIEHTAVNGNITISALACNGHVNIQVQDNGAGIPPGHIEHVFERFYRVDQSRSRDSGGSGLGLAISKALVEMHNGKIDVVSKENAGTRFTISLPVSHQ